MKIEGKFKLFIDQKEGGFRTYSTSISHKNENETYINTRLEIRFNKTNFPAENMAKLDPKKVYDLEVKDGYLDTRVWTNKDNVNVHVIFMQVQEATLTGSKEIKKELKNSDLPF